jgi:hypothetical protein
MNWKGRERRRLRPDVKTLVQTTDNYRAKSFMDGTYDDQISGVRLVWHVARME